MLSLPYTRLRSPSISRSTRRSRPTVEVEHDAQERSTRPSVSWLVPDQHGEASSVRRKGPARCCRSEGYWTAGRACQAATMTSGTPADRFGAAHGADRLELVDLRQHAGEVTRRVGLPVGERGPRRWSAASSSTRASSLVVTASRRRARGRAQNASAAAGAPAMMRSSRPAGSIPTARHLPRRDSFRRLPGGSMGPATSASQRFSFASSSPVATRKPSDVVGDLPGTSCGTRGSAPPARRGQRTQPSGAILFATSRSPPPRASRRRRDPRVPSRGVHPSSLCWVAGKYRGASEAVTSEDRHHRQADGMVVERGEAARSGGLGYLAAGVTFGSTRPSSSVSNATTIAGATPPERFVLALRSQSHPSRV